MLAHLTAIAVVGFSVWTLVFVAMPLALHWTDKGRQRPWGRPKAASHRAGSFE